MKTYVVCNVIVTEGQSLNVFIQVRIYPSRMQSSRLLFVLPIKLVSVIYTPGSWPVIKMSA